MPTTNGFIRSKDIVTDAVVARIIADDTVGTDHIVSAAVTEPKLEDPVWVDGGVALTLNDTSLDATDWADMASVVLTIPSWVTVAHLFWFGALQVTNTSGGNQNFVLRGSIAGGTFGPAEMTLVNNETGYVFRTAQTTVNAPGSTITFITQGKVTSGTNAGNIASIWARAIGTR